MPKIAMPQTTLVLTIKGGKKNRSNFKVETMIVEGRIFEESEKVDRRRIPNLGVITVATTTVATERAQIVAEDRGRGGKKEKKSDGQSGRIMINAKEEKENDLIRHPHHRLVRTRNQSPLLPRHRRPWTRR
jgi:hypothetical protein